MALRVFLTSDLHIGMKFADYPKAREQLEEERLACLARMVAEASARRCDLMVIAGDLFHRVSVPRRDIDRAAEALRSFTGRCVAVLPGNHDFLSPDDQLWPRFKERSGDAVLLLAEPRPYPLTAYDLDACIYPGPCYSSHSASSAVGWVKDAAGKDAFRHCLGVGHGSLEGVSPDFKESYFPMKSSELLQCGMTAWLLGHTHARYPARPGEQDRIYYPGVPAPDGFDCAHEGGAWVLELGAESAEHGGAESAEYGGAVHAEGVRTGLFRFIAREAEVTGAADLEKLQGEIDAAEPSRVLLRLRLKGRVSRETLSAVGPFAARLSESLAHLDLRTDGLFEEISRESIERDYAEGSFPYALLLKLLETGDLEAVRVAHELLGEARL
jgi:DNA repair protein SbcD/Mre11